ncbi:MAG TPA: HAMP domain-containing sensor histidine kinase [Rugosimonospora sp.]|nr:HAMP domain-containing sensor histidine kinase [Rugosimonospora sp.]
MMDPGWCRVREDSFRCDSAAGRLDAAVVSGLVEVLGVGVLIVRDGGDEVVLANERLLELLGVAERGAELAGASVARLRERSDAATVPLWDGISGGWGRPCQYGLAGGRVASGVWHRLQCGTGAPLLVLVVSDVTAQTQLRQRLREHNRALAELVATKTELVSVLSHELRTPLTSMNSMLQFLPAGSGDEVLDQSVDVIRRNVDRMGALVREISLINGIENNMIEMGTGRVDVADLLRQAVARWNGNPARDVRLSVAAPAGPPVQGDAEWLTEMVDRVLAVAIAVVPTPATIPVVAHAGETGWLITVPMPANSAADQLFTATDARGNATALMLARAVLSRHGGRLRMSTHDGRPGLEITLPYRSTATWAATGAPTTATAGG